MDTYRGGIGGEEEEEVDRDTTTSLLNSYLIPDTADFDSLYDNHTHTNISVNDISRDGGGQTDDTKILLKAYIHNMTYTSRKQAIANIIYSTINCGLVALPYSCSQSGIIIYILFIALISLISSYINIIIIAIAKEEKVRSLEELAEITFGATGYFMICLFQILYSILLMVMSLNVCTDIIISVADDNFRQITISPVSRRSAVIFLCSIVMLPMLLLTKSMSTLGFTSYISIITTGLVFLSIFVSFIFSQVTGNGIDDDSAIGFIDTVTPKGDWFIILFIITFCFANNQKMFGVYSCLRRRNSSRWKYAVYRSHIIVAFIYIVFGVFGYLSRVGSIDADNAYDNKINYFLSYTDNLNKTFYDIIRSIIALGLLLTLPTDCLVAKTTLRRLIRRFLRFKNEAAFAGDISNSNPGGETSISPSLQIVQQRKDEADGVHNSSSSIGYRDGSIGASSGLRESASTNSVDLESEWRTLESSAHTNNIIAHEVKNSPAKSKDSVGLFLHDSDVGSGSGCLASVRRNLCYLCLDQGTYESSLAGLGFWIIVIVLALSIRQWVLTILGFGIIATTMLNFIFPSMLYFRIGLTDDFHSIPVFGLIPNRIYMLCTQVLGVLFLLLGVIFTFITTH